MGVPDKSRDLQELASLRSRIDSADDRLVDVLAERMAIVREVAALKREHRLDTRQPERMREVFSRVRALGKARGLDPGFVEGLWKAIVDEAMRIESEALAGAPARRPDRGPPKAKDKKELSCRRP